MSAKNKEAQKKEYNARAVYTGRRLGGGKVWQRFELLPDRREMYFSGVKGLYIGYAYECTDKTIPARPKCDHEIKREDNPEWDAADAVVDARNAERRAQAKMKEESRPALKKAVEALKPLMRGLSVFDREALIKYLADQARK